MSDSLGLDFTIEFAAGLSPLYVSPEELVSIFPDATLLDAAEAIHKASLEIEEILNLSSDEVPVYIALDYVLAQAACILSRTFDFAADAMSIVLGDLSVQNAKYPKNSVNRGNATTPCELAAALRKELLYKTTRSKATVRGSNYENPIPNRKLKDLSKGRVNETWYQGRLDDNDGSP